MSLTRRPLVTATARTEISSAAWWPTIEPPKGPANPTGHASSRHRRDKDGAWGCQRKRARSHENCGEHYINRCDGLAHPQADDES